MHERVKAEVVQLCQSLVQTPSVNGLYPERAVDEKVVQFARQHALQADLVGAESDRPNVLVRVGPGGAQLGDHQASISRNQQQAILLEAILSTLKAIQMK